MGLQNSSNVQKEGKKGINRNLWEIIGNNMNTMEI